MVGGCSAFGVEPLGEQLDATGPVLALTSFAGSEVPRPSVRAGASGPEVVRVYSGTRESDNFGWAAACVGDLDGDGARDLGRLVALFISRSRCSRASGATLWSIASSQTERAEAENDAEGPSPNWIDGIQPLEDVDGDGVPEVAIGIPLERVVPRLGVPGVGSDGNDPVSASTANPRRGRACLRT
jgi:hypothetical protein